MVTNNEAFTQPLARSDKKRDIYIPEKSRYLNTVVIGTKNSGKTYEMLPLMAKQDIENKDCGATFIVGKKDMAFFLYSMARKHGRKVVMLKPSTSMEADALLWQESYDYDYVNNNVIDYKEAIKKKHIVIIDMEYSKYRGRSLRATAMLLLQLQLDMQDWADTLKRPHFVYIDDAQYYLPFIEVLLTNGDDYNVGTTLFMQSRNQFKQKDRNYTSLIDNNIRSVILMNGLNMADIEYYQKQFYEHNINVLINRKHGQIIYETVDNTNTRRNGFADLILLDDEYRTELEEKGLGLKKKLTKKKRKLEKGEELDLEDTLDLDEIEIGSNDEAEDNKETQLTKESSDIEFVIPEVKEDSKEDDKKDKKEEKVDVKQVITPVKVEKITPKKPRTETKKAPKQIVADDFNKNSSKYIICDSDFDFNDEF